MKKQQDKNFESEIRRILRGRQVPILVLDSRWYSLFPKGDKPVEVEELEKQVNTLLKRQGKLVNEIKELKQAKKKLMEGIVAGMDAEESSRTKKKKDNQQRLLLETKARIEENSGELMGLPSQIKSANEELLIAGAKYCFKRLADSDEKLKTLTEEIRIQKEELNEKMDAKAELEESLDSAYSLMHTLLGHDVMNLFDEGKIG